MERLSVGDTGDMALAGGRDRRRRRRAPPARTSIDFSCVLVPCSQHAERNHARVPCRALRYDTRNCACSTRMCIGGRGGVDHEHPCIMYVHVCTPCPGPVAMAPYRGHIPCLGRFRHRAKTQIHECDCWCAWELNCDYRRVSVCPPACLEALTRVSPTHRDTLKLVQQRHGSLTTRSSRHVSPGQGVLSRSLDWRSKTNGSSYRPRFSPIQDEGASTSYP